MNRSVLAAVAVISLLIAAIGVGLFLLLERNVAIGPDGVGLGSGSGAPDIGGAFSLTDDQGLPVTEKTLVGDKYHLIFFGFTNCPDVCPGMLSTVAGIYEKLTPEQQARVQMVFVSVDPDRDTKEKLHEYVTAFNPTFVGWTGTKAQIDGMTRNYLAYYAIRKDGKDPTVTVSSTGAGMGGGDYMVDHSAILYLMGPDGAYVTHFRNSDSATSILERLQEVWAR